MVRCAVYFNSRPHGGRPLSGLTCCSPSRISTHALTEGDYLARQSPEDQEISTHALTEGDGEFQDISNMVDISTHALTEGDF